MHVMCLRLVNSVFGCCFYTICVLFLQYANVNRPNSLIKNSAKVSNLSALRFLCSPLFFVHFFLFLAVSCCHVCVWFHCAGSKPGANKQIYWEWAKFFFSVQRFTSSSVGIRITKQFWNWCVIVSVFISNENRVCIYWIVNAWLCDACTLYMILTYLTIFDKHTYNYTL